MFEQGRSFQGQSCYEILNKSRHVHLRQETTQQNKDIPWEGTESGAKHKRGAKNKEALNGIS